MLFKSTQLNRNSVVCVIANETTIYQIKNRVDVWNYRLPFRKLKYTLI